ncbi:aspartate aminotransferase family protein [Streptomyces sp. NPDC046821]|uniref:aminotransferase family protein n=1 Tax=Streptomyces sp. NPDC046821 TaxID=3154702 RepID=UPI0033CE881B
MTVADVRAAEELAAIDAEFLIHPHGAPGPGERMIVTRGKGARIWDSTGREYIDGTGGGLWANLVGHGRTELADVARKELADLGFFCTFWEFSNPAQIRLAKRLVELAPEGIAKVNLTAGGTEGIESALKMARLFHFESGHPEKQWILSRRSSYHGVGYGSTAATDFDWLRHGFGPQPAGFAHLTPPWPYHSELYGDQDPTDFLIAELLETIERIGPEKIAAFVGEPIMGVGGMLVPPDDYWPRVEAILREHDILLILDEVVTGYGRAGHHFAAERYGLRPDIIVSAKGITSGYFPVGAVLMTDRVAQGISSGDHGFPIGYTYAGHPAGAAVALANLDIIEREGLVDRAAQMGEFLATRLKSLLDVPLVGEVRNVGLMAAVEVVTDRRKRTPMESVDAIAAEIRATHGAIVRPSVGSALILSPPLTITEDELDVCVDAIGEVLRRTNTDGTVNARK